LARDNDFERLKGGAAVQKQQNPLGRLAYKDYIDLTDFRPGALLGPSAFGGAVTQPAGMYGNVLSACQAWAPGVATTIGTRVVPTIANSTGYGYICTANAGDTTTGGSEPTWPTQPGSNTTPSTVQDHNVTWSTTVIGVRVDVGALPSGTVTGNATTTDSTTHTFGSGGTTGYGVFATVCTMSITIFATTNVNLVGFVLSGAYSTRSSAASGDDGVFQLLRDGSTNLYAFTDNITGTAGGNPLIQSNNFHWPGVVTDTGISGSHTYTLQMKIDNGSANGTFAGSKSKAILWALNILK